MIHTNHIPRDLDYQTPEWASEPEACFTYRGEVYFVSEFSITDGIPDFIGWDGYSPDSFFSGILIKLCEDGESVIVGWYSN